jgi:hypothetical protein
LDREARQLYLLGDDDDRPEPEGRVVGPAVEAKFRQVLCAFAAMGITI